MTPDEFRAAYPQLLAWIQKTLGAYEAAYRLDALCASAAVFRPQPARDGQIQYRSTADTAARGDRVQPLNIETQVSGS
jgi:hypothetical protein